MARPFLKLKEENESKLLTEIKAKKTCLTALPPRATYEISWRCNYNCKKCSYSSLAQGPDFSAVDRPEWDWESIESIADELFPTMRYTESTLLGEPFLSPKFKKLMELYRRYGVYYRPTTNASLLTEDKLEHIAGVVDWLKCSFDAHNADLYRKLYLNDNFPRVADNLKRFSESRRYMDPHPWFRVGLVLMRSNLYSLKDYADFVFQELGVDDMEIMALNYANDQMSDEFYWDIPDEVNRRIDELIDHCIAKKYRLRLAFTRMPRRDMTWIGDTSVGRSMELARTQPPADNSGYEKYSDEVRNGDIFGNKEQLESGYVWSNDMRIASLTADDLSTIGVCEFFTRPFFKPPTTESDGKAWIKFESCGSCSTFVFGNLKEKSFAELYNSPMMQEVRGFLYRKYQLPRSEWMFPCRHCLCIDQIYSEASNGRANAGVRVFPEDDLYSATRRATCAPSVKRANKVLVFCSDVLPLGGMATSGGGLRSWQIVEGLRAHGFDVTYSMPEESYLSRTFAHAIPAGMRERLWNNVNQRQIIEAEKPDVIVLTKAAHKFWPDDIGIPLALDFHGPDIIEFEQMVKGCQPAGREDRVAQKIRTLAEADFFTCAGKRQRYYFMAFLLLAGVDLEDIQIHYMPVSMSGVPPEREPDLSNKFIIFAGGFYPWLDPTRGLADLARCIGQNGYSLEIFGGSHETNPEEKRRFEQFKAEMKRNPRVTFHGTVPREELMSWYKKASLAFELMPQNPEREMAFTTRTVEFLWAGIPVIYNDYAELSELIARYQAGWLVPPGNSRELEKVIELITDDPGAVSRASENARRLVSENLTCEKVIAPLAEFCRRPERRRRRPCKLLTAETLARGLGGNGKTKEVDRLYLKYGDRSGWKLGYKLLWHTAVDSVRRLF